MTLDISTKTPLLELGILHEFILGIYGTGAENTKTGQHVLNFARVLTGLN